MIIMTSLTITMMMMMMMLALTITIMMTITMMIDITIVIIIIIRLFTSTLDKSRVGATSMRFVWTSLASFFNGQVWQVFFTLQVWQVFFLTLPFGSNPFESIRKEVRFPDQLATGSDF